MADLNQALSLGESLVISLDCVGRAITDAATAIEGVGSGLRDVADSISEDDEMSLVAAVDQAGLSVKSGLLALAEAVGGLRVKEA